jgi:hypothetical protein
MTDLPGYVFDLEYDFPETVEHLNLGDYCIDFRLGLLLRRDEVVLMSVVLVPGSSFLDDLDGIYDLRFGIRTASIEYSWKVSGLYFDQKIVNQAIPKKYREDALRLLKSAIRTLVSTVEPPQITMSTYDAELPEKALVKYVEIESLLHTMGYRTVDAYQGDDGKHRWHFAT